MSFDHGGVVHGRMHNAIPHWVTHPDLVDALRFVMACPGVCVRIVRARTSTAYFPAGALTLRGFYAQHATSCGRPQRLVVFETGGALMPWNRMDLCVRLGSGFKRRTRDNDCEPEPLVARNDQFVDANLTLACADLAQAMRTRDAAEAYLRSLPGLRDLVPLTLEYVNFAADVCIQLAPADQ